MTLIVRLKAQPYPNEYLIPLYRELLTVGSVANSTSFTGHYTLAQVVTYL